MNDHDDETRVPADAPTALAETPDRSRLALLGALTAGAAAGACTPVGRSDAPVVTGDPRFTPIDTSSTDGGDGGGGGGGGAH